MADYRDKLDEWREAARRKARDLDEKYNIRERVEEGARAAGEAAKRGADAVKTGAERAREEAGRMGEDFDVSEHAADARERSREAREQAARAAEEAARLAREVGGRVREVGQKAGERAEDFLGGARGLLARLAAALACGVGVLAEVQVLADALGLGARPLGARLDGVGPALGGLARDARALLDALADVVLLVQVARLAPRRLAPLVKPVPVVSHKFSRNAEV